jgi:hypothetical protein
MKKYLLIMLVAFVGYGCASVYSPAGNWDYVVVGTPNGDVDGTLVLTENEGAYSGKFMSDMGELVLENVKYSEEEGLSATFWVQGMEMTMTGKFAEDDFTGMVDGGSQIGSWPMTAKRITEEK